MRRLSAESTVAVRVRMPASMKAHVMRQSGGASVYLRSLVEKDMAVRLRYGGKT